MKIKLILLICTGLMISSVHAAEKRITLNGLQQKIEQITKDQAAQSAIMEKEQSGLIKKMRELELKLSQADKTAKFEPYSYP